MVYMHNHRESKIENCFAWPGNAKQNLGTITETGGKQRNIVEMKKPYGSVINNPNHPCFICQ